MSAPFPGVQPAVDAVRQALHEAEVEFEEPAPRTFVASLPGEHKLRTTVSLVVGDHSLSINAFVVRAAEENHREVYRWLLEHNLRAPGVAFAVDHLGDVYLVGRLPLDTVTPEEVDRLLGAILGLSDGSFDTLLQLGFAGSIRREYAWRTSRGEPTDNLAAFTKVLNQTDGPR